MTVKKALSAEIVSLIYFYKQQGLPGVAHLVYFLATDGEKIREIGSTEYRIHEVIALCQSEAEAAHVSLIYNHALYFGSTEKQEMPLKTLSRMQSAVLRLDGESLSNLDAFCSDLALCAMGKRKQPMMVNTITYTQ